MENIRKIERTCLNPKCQQLFQAPVKEINRGHGKYCRQSCATTHTNSLRKKIVHEPNASCSYCQMTFYIDKDRKSASKSGLYFCCREHKDISQRIGGIEAIQPDHYGTTLKDYRDIAFRHYPKVCMRCGYDKFVVVHHRDYNRSNNSLENLEIICPNCHALEHWAKD